MNNKSDTNSIRHYCALHKQMIFDVSEVKDKFPVVSDSNFRKYVSRLVEERVLTVISKGIYFIGDELPDNLEKLLQKLCNNFSKVAIYYYYYYYYVCANCNNFLDLFNNFNLS